MVESAFARGALALVTITSIVWGVWQVGEYLGGFRSGYERWLYAPFVLAAVTGIIVLGPRRHNPNVTRVKRGEPGIAATPRSSVNPLAVAWFVALCLAGGAAQLIAFLEMT